MTFFLMNSKSLWWLRSAIIKFKNKNIKVKEIEKQKQKSKSK